MNTVTMTGVIIPWCMNMIWTAAMLKNKKRPYLGKGLTDLHEIWRGIAHWPSEGYLQLKFWTLKNPRWPTTAILRNQKMAISRKRLARSARNLARRQILALRWAWALKCQTFKISSWLTSTILKMENRPYLGNGLSNLHEIWHNDAYWTSKWYGQLKFKLLKIQDGGRPPFW